MAECLQEEVFGEINPSQKDAIATIQNSGNHLLELIQDMLDVSKIMAGMLKIDIKTISIADLCNSSLELTKQQALKKQIQLTTSVFSNTEVIAVDPHRIRQVLVNLLDNAVKFTPSGGKVDLDVRIVNDLSRELILSHSVANSCWIKFSITDTGIGISPSDRDMLFQPFIQIDSGLNRKYEGSGLGLVIVKQIVELHGGYVDVSSQIDQGSCFTVYLPTKIARLPIL
jgi:signal transduction histidine kinase